MKTEQLQNNFFDDYTRQLEQMKLRKMRTKFLINYTHKQILITSVIKKKVEEQDKGQKYKNNTNTFGKTKYKIYQTTRT